MWQTVLQAYIARRQAAREHAAETGQPSTLAPSDRPIERVRAGFRTVGRAVTERLPVAGGIAILLVTITFLLLAIVPAANGETRLALLWGVLTDRGNTTPTLDTQTLAAGTVSGPPLATDFYGGKRAR